MVTILKVRVTSDHEPPKTVYPTEQVFATVEAAREFFKNEFKTNKIILCYVNK